MPNDFLNIFRRTHMVGATVVGPRHARERSLNQDAWSAVLCNSGAMIVVSDGVGSARHSRIGSRCACRAATETFTNLGNDFTLEQLTTGIINRWHQLLDNYNPIECAATCLVAVRLNSGRLVVGGIGDGIAAVVGCNIPNRYQVIQLIGGEFGETVALGDGKESHGWVFEEFNDAPATICTILATDGISNDLVHERLPDFAVWLCERFKKTSRRKWRTGLRRELSEWPNPGSSDDKTIALLWREERSLQ